MHYKFFSAQDFIQDEFFQQWVYAPNEENDRYWKSFLTHYPEQRIIVEEAREFLRAMNFDRTVQEDLLQRIKLGFNRAIDAHEASAGVAGQSTSARNPSRNLSIVTYSIAACVALIAVVAGYLLFRENEAKNIYQAFRLNEEATPKGEQRRIALDDGTVVWMNANSSLRYSKNFATEALREVYLEGEAYFDVSEDREKPFVVHTSGIAIRVLGTSFNVRSYATDPVVETTLVEGKVTITSPEQELLPALTLLPNQQALFNKDSKKIELTESVNPEAYTGWKNGLMVFDNKSFAYIKETLERWYGVTIQMEDEQSLMCTFSARFRDKTLKEVLEIFKDTEAINYLIDGDRVLITGKLCQYEKAN
jgi:transmembrane sensor